MISVWHLRPTTSLPTDVIVKRSKAMSSRYRCNEAMTVEFIRRTTTIPVPRVLQVTLGKLDNGDRNYTYFAMEYIKGHTLEKCWPHLNIFKKVCIAWTLRGYVRQLRRLRRSFPGPIDNTVQFEGGFFSQSGSGPFATHEELIAYYNRRLEISKERRRCPPDTPRFEMSGPLVFTHQDLCLRNLLLGDDGLLYVLDWEWAGFYPEWLEFAGLKRNITFEYLPREFCFFLPLITGVFFSFICPVPAIRLYHTGINSKIWSQLSAIYWTFVSGRFIK